MSLTSRPRWRCGRRAADVRFVKDWQKQQSRLNIATFNGSEEIIVLTDYAAVYEMKGKKMRTCEHGTTSNQLVALVLHSPGATPADGSERPVICDYWRFWSNQKGNAAQHHMAMREIAEFYKYGGPRPGAPSAGERLGEGDLGEVAAKRRRRAAAVPGLKRMNVWSDGQRSQYKGEKSFGRDAEWPKSVAAGGMEIELFHHFYESHHASGPQDNAGEPRARLLLFSSPLTTDHAGKDPRRAMDRAIVHEKSELIYDYHRCLEWCAKHMPRPDDSKEHSGTWGCNGEYHWRAFSNGADPHSHLYPNIPQTKREWGAVAGSNSLYCIRAGPGVNLPGRFELHCSFLSCFCESCRLGQAGSDHRNCEALGTVQKPFFVELHEKPRGRARPPTRRRAAASAAAAAAAAAAAVETVTTATTATAMCWTPSW